tara:strand:+ start:1068 stop:1361 length:294 start_codon:yes stop_codon:yes gene_type:complete
MDHSHHTRLEGEELTAQTLKGATIYGADDTVLGRVSHLHGSGAACQVIVEVSQASGGTKPVAVGLGQLEFMRDETGGVHAITSWTSKQVQTMPEHRE